MTLVCFVIWLGKNSILCLLSFMQLDIVWILNQEGPNQALEIIYILYWCQHLYEIYKHLFAKGWKSSIWKSIRRLLLYIRTTQCSIKAVMKRVLTSRKDQVRRYEFLRKGIGGCEEMRENRKTSACFGRGAYADWCKVLTKSIIIRGVVIRRAV